MSFRHKGNEAHDEQAAFDAWKKKHEQLIADTGLPPGVSRSKRDWDYLLQFGYWCEDYYGKYVTNIDFDLDELSPDELLAFKHLLELTLSKEGNDRCGVAWPRVKHL